MWQILFVFILFLISGCSPSEKNQYVEKTITIPKNPWGNFKYEPISKADSSLKSAADATAFIKLASGSGSGFFIEHQNQVLLVTNHHVLGKNQCTKNGCVGFLAVRGFYPGGPNEKLDQLTPLMMSKDLDVSFFKTPYAPGDIPTLSVKKDFNKNDRVYSIGHPSASTSRYSSLKILFSVGPKIFAEGGLWHGNSGGPIVDQNSLEVIGVASFYHEQSGLTTEGFYENNNRPGGVHLHYALSILDSLDKQNTRTKRQLQPPNCVKEMATDTDWFISTGWKLINILPAIELVFDRKKYSSNTNRINQILMAYRQIYINNKYKLPLEVFEYVRKELNNEDYYIHLTADDHKNSQIEKERLFTLAEILHQQNEQQVNACTQVYERKWLPKLADTHSKIDLFWEESINLSDVIYQNCFHMPKIDFSPLKSEYPKISRLSVNSQEAIYDILRDYTVLHNSSEARSPFLLSALSALRHFAETADSIQGSFGAEGLLHSVSRLPELVKIGWLNESTQKQLIQVGFDESEQACTQTDPL